MLIACCLLCVGVLGGVIAENIVMATTIESGDVNTETQSESLLDYLIRYVHAHAHQLHRHLHDE